ncbi:unnamed protein product [Porites lobata]|uniref:Uncharacterized protein n=1 Tax=Porites lobata TaxID=104759 RepID=A0ABN8RM64_9CNID|nr:unnamed protein product [Porites lobata]
MKSKPLLFFFAPPCTLDLSIRRLVGTRILVCCGQKSRDDKEKPLLLFFSDFEGTLD